VRGPVDSLLRPVGYAVVGSGGLSQVRNYSLRRLRLPVPIISTLGRATQFEVDLDRTTTPCGFSYHPEGWHPYRQTLSELIAEPGLAYEHTTLHRFYGRFQPSTVQEAVLEDEPEPLDPIGRWPPLRPLFTQLWGVTPRQVDQILRSPDRYAGLRQQFGPNPAEVGREQVERVWRAYQSLSRRGYRPAEYPDGYLTGYFLVRGGEYRFVVLHGNHRLAAFRELGIQRLVARTQRDHPPVVDTERLGEWTTGRFGIFPLAVAQRLFDKLFSERGVEKARNVGVL
jgi:hypothetical protein